MHYCDVEVKYIVFTSPPNKNLKSVMRNLVYKWKKMTKHL